MTSILGQFVRLKNRTWYFSGLYAATATSIHLKFLCILGIMSLRPFFDANSGTPFEQATDIIENVAKPVNMHHAHHVCVKPPSLLYQEPAKEKSRNKERKRQPTLITNDESQPPLMMSPSQFLAELKQSTKERLANTHTMHLPRKMTSLIVDPTSVNKTFQVSPYEPLFQAFPSEMFFQNFVPMHTYYLPLTLRNKDVVSRHIRVTQLDSPYFRVVTPASHGDKVGPGISLTFDVYFLPNEYKDYEHELTFITDRESFVVPIHAIGARAFLDFPDNVHFSMNAVKHPVSKPLLIRNIGNRTAKFTLKMEKSEKKSFSVTPEVGCLGVEEVRQVTIQFHPMQTGNHHGKMIIIYDTGEQIQVTLYGSAQDVNVQLSQKSILMPSTFVGTLTQHSISIHNHSDIRAFFRWTQMATQEEEDQQKFLFHMEILRDEQREAYVCMVPKEQSVSVCKMPTLSRDFHNKLQAVNNKTMLFEDEVFRFDPVEGEVWPKSSIDVNIIFKPVKAAHYSPVAFCDISGRQSRLPLRIDGEGMGPKLDFSFVDLDMGNIFVGVKNFYELVVWNKGAINATYSILPNFNNYGPCFDFDPSDGKISAGDFQAIRVTFLSRTLGKICECFLFQVDDTMEKKEVIFKGAVIAPSFHFSVSKLDFGIVSYGFPCKRTFRLINTSLVSISYNLRVPSDGSLSSLQAMGGEGGGDQKGPLPLRGLALAKEFDIRPCRGVIEAHSFVEVVVVLTSNHVQNYEETMVVDVRDVGRELKGLHLFARCVVPRITLLTPELDYGRSCLRYPFQRQVLLCNDSDWPATYIVPPQATSSQAKDQPPSILYCSPQPRGLIDPHSVQEVVIEIQVQRLSEQWVICCIAIFGSEEPMMKVRLKCSGEGPVVHLQPERLDWGTIPVLTNVSKTFLLSNQSLITTSYTAFFTSLKAPFTVSPEKGEIPPESFSTLTVTAYLDDCMTFQSTLQLMFEESNSRRVPVEATGEGTLVVSDPPLLPYIDLGSNFCNSRVVRTFKLTNKCRRHHQIMWSTEGFSWSQTKRCMTNGPKNSTKSKNKGRSPAVDNSAPVFTVTPARFGLKPGQSIDLTVEGCVSETRSASEMLVCQAILGNSGSKDVIMRTQFSAVFVRPILEFSSKAILFHVEKKAQDKLEVMEQHLEFCNASTLPLSITMELHYPFSIFQPQQGNTTEHKELYLPDQEKHDLILRFDPNYKKDLHNRTIDDVLYFRYKEHSHVDKVSLKGEVLFPNLMFDSTEVNFGCILNDTEVTRHVYMWNTGPLQVKYRWSFLVDPTQIQIRRIIRPTVPAFKIPDASREASSSDQQLEVCEATMEGEEEQEMTAVSKGDLEPVQMSEDCLKEVGLTPSVTKEEEKVEGEAAPLAQLGGATVGEASETADSSVGFLPGPSPASLVEVSTKQPPPPSLRVNSVSHMSFDRKEKGTNEENDRLAAEANEGHPHQPAPPVQELEAVETNTTPVEAEREVGACMVDKNNLVLSGKETEALNSNYVLLELMKTHCTTAPLSGVEEVFDILPLYGTLNSGDSEQVTFSFFGHANIFGEVKAMCEVEGGPTYEVMVSGEANLVEYHFEVTELDFGKQLYDTVGVKELTLVNTGRVPFTYYALDIQTVHLDHTKPGQLGLVPQSGTMDPFSSQKLQVRFLPGVPGPFSKRFLVQVAHFEQDVIHIYGEGVFPRISLDLPRYMADDDSAQSYQSLLLEACKNLMPQKSETSLAEFTASYLQDASCCQGCRCGDGEGSRWGSSLSSTTTTEGRDAMLQETVEVLPTRQDIELEVELLSMRNFALHRMASDYQCLAHSTQCNEREALEDNDRESQTSLSPRNMLSAVFPSSMSAKKVKEDASAAAAQSGSTKKPKPRLTQYLLDFGYVVLGTQRCHTVRATNTGWCPVYFRVKRQHGNCAFSRMGFLVGLDKVCHLPGAPQCESVDFIVSFDPKAANLPVGPVEVKVLIDILRGSMVELILKAQVTVPSMRLSSERLEVGAVKCGECCITIVQLHNHQHVPCAWTALTTSTSATMSGTGRMEPPWAPLNLRRRSKLARRALTPFEVLPVGGTLQPDHRINVQVIFTPTEEKEYEETVHFKISQSEQQLVLACCGQGLEPRLEFGQCVVNFSPILPFSEGDWQTMVINNPCSFPVEMYCLELDNQYLEEEKVLRKIRGYNDRNMLLLPPRNAGDKLHHELLEYYEEFRTRGQEEEATQEGLSSKLSNLSIEGTVENDGNSKSEMTNPDEAKPVSAEEQKKMSELADPLVSTTTIHTQAALTQLPKGDQQDMITMGQDADIAQDQPIIEASQDLVASPGVSRQVDNSPVLMALAAHLGIDLTQQGKPTIHNSGIAIIVHGTPCSGKSLTAITLAQQYEAALLTLDGVVIDAITTPTSATALVARELCEEVARCRAEELRVMEEQMLEVSTVRISADPPTPVEAKAGTGGKHKEKFTSKSIISDKQTNIQAVDGRPVSQQLSISSAGGAEDGLASCVLPEQVLINLLVERLQMEDCRYGVVFDGLETLFAASMFTAANIILRALNNRRFIFCCSLKQDYAAYQEQEKGHEEARERQAKMKEELERQKIEDMEEDEYDALSQSEKDRLDQARLNLKKQRMKRDQEERERKEREREEEERRKEEELKNSKRKKQVVKKKSEMPIQLSTVDLDAGVHHNKNHDIEVKKGKKVLKAVKHEEVKNVASEAPLVVVMETIRDLVKEAEAALLKRFQCFDYWYKDLSALMDLWDRTTLQLRRPPGFPDPSEEEPVKKGKGKGEKEKAEKAEKDRQKQQVKELPGFGLRQGNVLDEISELEMEGGEEEECGRVPNIVVDCTDHSCPAWQKILDSGMLPSKEEVLDGMGRGPQGPPIPPPITLAVVPYPVRRKQRPPVNQHDHFVFVECFPEDPLTPAGNQDNQEQEAEEEKTDCPSSGSKGKGVAKATRGGGAATLEAFSVRPSKEQKSKKSSKLDVTALFPTTPLQGTTHEKLTTFRWIIPAQGQLKLRIYFSSEEVGQFEQNIRFEIVGMRRHYHVVCNGTCAFPTISRDPKIFFRFRKKMRKEKEIVHRKYIQATHMYEFGPLLVGKNRDKASFTSIVYADKYPDNCDIFYIHNPTSQTADVTFGLLHDYKQALFKLDATSLSVLPGETLPLSICASPMAPGRFQDALVCCIRENPEPVIFPIACNGVRPELVLDKKQLHFDKTLVHRRDTKVICLHNPTMLPVAWRLVGLDNLGEDFTVGADCGVLEPLSVYPLHAYFRAIKPVQTTKRMIRLEVSDVEDTLGVVQSEPIQVIAEAYDVSMDLTFAKGLGSCVEYGPVRVNDEVGQAITLRNKGKYEIGCQFVVEKDDPELASFFSFTPSKMSLPALDKPNQVMVTCKCPHDLELKDMPLFKCLLTESPIAVGKAEKGEDRGEKRELIATIPIKVSLKAVYSNYTIVPSTDINFGCLLVNTKKMRILTIQNNGEFDFKCTIRKKSDSILPVPSSLIGNTRKQMMDMSRKVSRNVGSMSLQHSGKRESRNDATGGRVLVGPFTISPACCIVKPSNTSNITIECSADREGVAIEELTVSISESNPKTHPVVGLPYKLIAEGCVCSINVEDVHSIFEEHHVCKNLLYLPTEFQIESGGVYGEEEKRFVFSHVFVGRKAKARFKISSTSIVPCEVAFFLRPPPQKTSHKVPALPPPEVFEVEPQKATILGHSHVFVTVFFIPTAMQVYNTVFEAINESQFRSKMLTFEVVGEGTLPRVTVTQPSVRKSNDQPLMVFNKVLVGRSQVLPLTLVNSSLLPCKVDMDVMDSDGVFTLQPAGDRQQGSDDSRTSLYKWHTASVVLAVEETASFDVRYSPLADVRSSAVVKLCVVDNPYEDSVVVLVGEGHKDEVTLDNISGCRPIPIRLSTPTGFTAESGLQSAIETSQDDISMDPVADCQELSFGDCPVSVPHTVTFSMTNNFPRDCVRFTWPQDPLLSFSPQVGHLHPGCTKEIAVTFMATEPVTLNKKVVTGRVVTVQFNSPLDQVADWDDRLKVVKWVDVERARDEKPTRPLKRKVVENQSEAPHTEVVESVREVGVLVSALCDYCRFQCSTHALHFADTLMFQTRHEQLVVQNSGTVTLSYLWWVTMEQVPSPVHCSLTALGEQRADTTTFSVEPSRGTIEPGQAAKFLVKFAPLDAGLHVASLSCSILNLDPESNGGLSILVQGEGHLPLCHFDLHLSDYLSKLRRNPCLPGPLGAAPGTQLDPCTQVVECHVVGLNVVCIREFNIINPTSTKYQYEWLCEDGMNQRPLQTPRPAFKFIYPQGCIHSGRRERMVLRFVSSQLGTVESFWRFTIPLHSISIPFLLVGHTQEPHVFFDKAHITFKPLLIGHRETETVHMINKESKALNFQFVENSCHTEGFASRVILDPLSGKVPPNSRVPINLTFVPTLEKEVTFNILCKIQHCVLPLTLNIKAEGYAINCNLYCKNSAGKKVQLMSRGINTINFGNVDVKDEAIRQLYISNVSLKYNLDYSWKLCFDDDVTTTTTTTPNPAAQRPPVRISEESGSVPSGEMAKCLLSYCPLECGPMKGCQLTLKTNKGPAFSMMVSGQGVFPGLQLSFHTHHFGHVLVTPCLEPPPSTTLVLTNTHTKDISVNCLYNPTPQLHHCFEHCVLGVGKTVSVPFIFTPPLVLNYRERVVFKVNSTSQHIVEFTGTGCNVKVEVADKSHRQVHLGSRFVGDVVRKEIPIINHSPAPITLHLFFAPSCYQLQSVGLLSVGPSGPFTLSANGGELQVQVLFQPKGRIPDFTEQVLAVSGPLSLPLFTLTGSCLGLDVTLETNYIPFGTVYLRSATSRKLSMTNRGDINTRFCWDVNHFLPDFSISPVEGYITPGMDITFEVKFYPQKTSADIRYENLQCFLDGAPHPPVLLTLTGSCTDIAPMKETVAFSTQVRGKDSRSIPILNNSLQTWVLTPVIEGTYWSGPTTLTVEPQQTRLYEIVYSPLTMTVDGKHMGTVFFAFPDGLGQLYMLVGSALAPKLSGRVTQDTPAKTEYTQTLPVHNWLTKSMRFAAKIDVLSEKFGKSDPGLKITSVDYIDVPANSHNTYKFQVYACREVPLHLKVTFTHEASGEYQWFEVHLRFTKPGSLATIDLCTPVRRALRHKLVIDNPLSQQAIFNAVCSVPEVSLPATTLVLPPLSKGQFVFDYMPMKVGEIHSKLELWNSDLGHSIYDLDLRAVPALQEKPLYFNPVPLGQSQVQTLRFTAYTKQKTEYICKVDNADFQVDKTLTVTPAPVQLGVSSTGTEVAIDVVFEPSIIGEQSTSLSVSSPVAGDYQFHLQASCQAPTPQGPILVKVGGCTPPIIFRNVFFSSVQLSLQVDPPLFRVQKVKEKVRPKKDQRISVYFDGNRESRGEVNGRLVVSCLSPSDGVSVIQWVYYLKGTTSKQDYHRQSSY